MKSSATMTIGEVAGHFGLATDVLRPPYHGAADGSTINTFTHGLANALISATADR